MYAPRRYAVLFYALLLTLLLTPLASVLMLPGILLRLLLALCLIAAVMPHAGKRGGLLLFMGIVALVVAKTASDRGLVPVDPAVLLALIGLTGLAAAAAALRFTVAGSSVTGEKIYAALSTYLLAGVFFGQIYWSLNAMEPGSIVGSDPFTDDAAVYYSFVTLATLGYGDFLPRSEIARGLATIEVIGGQLFLAVMVARLIGAFGGRKPAV